MTARHPRRGEQRRISANDFIIEKGVYISVNRKSGQIVCRGMVEASNTPSAAHRHLHYYLYYADKYTSITVMMYMTVLFSLCK